MIQRIGLGAGMVVLALAGASVVLPQPVACGGLPATYPAIIAFELARSAADLALIFGAPEAPSACRDAMIAAMDRANVVDSVAFVPAYAVMLGAFFLAERRRAGLLVALLAAVTDELENLCLFALTPALDVGATAFALLPWITGAKWLALGVAGALAGAALWARGGAWRVATVAGATALVATVLALVSPPTFGAVATPGVAVSWIAMIVSLSHGVLRRKTA